MVAPNQPLSIQIIADMTALLTSLETGNTHLSRMELLVQALSDRLRTAGQIQIFADLARDFQNVDRISQEMRDNINAVSADLSSRMQETGESLNVVTEAFIRTNTENQRHNALVERGLTLLSETATQMMVTDEMNEAMAESFRQAFDSKEISIAKAELESYQKILTVFQQSSTETWTTFNAMVTKAGENIVRNREAIQMVIRAIQDMRASGASLREIELAMRDANSEFSKLVGTGILSAAFRQVADAEREAARALEDYLRTIERTGQAWGQAPIQTANQMRGSFGGLNTIAQVFFGTTLGGLGMTAMRAFSNVLQETTKNGEEWSRTMFNMSVAVRALQRTGVEITLKDMDAQVSKLRNQFGFFTTRELQEGISQIALLTRNVGLTKEEMFQLSEATATLAIITGKDFGEQGLLVARSIASGYTEALQRAGIAANRLAIQNKAATMGIHKSFLQMTEQERAAVTLALVLDQVAAVSGDTAKFQETLAGRMQEANVAIQEQKDAIGRIWLPISTAWRSGLAFLMKGLTWLVTRLRDFIVFQAANVGAFAITISTMILTLFTNTGEFIKRGIWEWVDVFNKARDQLQYSMKDDPRLLDAPEDQFGIFPPEYVGEEGANDFEEQFKKLEEDIDDIVTDYLRKLEDIFIDKLRKEEDINRKYTFKAIDLAIDYQADIDKLERDYLAKLSDAYAKHRNDQIKAEEDFQEKMTQLREKFIFDLEDAVRERDARAVLRLIRDYNLRTTQMTREEELARQQRERDFQLELAQMAAQRQRRLDEMRIEYDMRIAEMAIQKQRELEELDIWETRQKEDAKIARDRRLADLRESLNDEMKMYFDHGVALIDWSKTTVDTVNEIFSKMYPFAMGGGSKNTIYGGYDVKGINYGAGTGGGIKKFIIDALQDPFSGINVGGGGAEGGTAVVKKPTLFMAGEAGREAVTFSPLRRTGLDEGKIFGAGLLPSSGGGSSSILVMLEPGLKAEIIGSALDGVADIMVETMRK